MSQQPSLTEIVKPIEEGFIKMIDEWLAENPNATFADFLEQFDNGFSAKMVEVSGQKPQDFLFYMMGAIILKRVQEMFARLPPGTADPIWLERD